MNSFTAQIFADKQKLRVAFLNHESDERACYIKDLQASLKINKEIIQELCAKKEENKTQFVLAKLNEENKLLHGEVAELRKKLSDSTARELIAGQIVADYRLKEIERESEHQERIKELQDQLSRKEFNFQMTEMKYNPQLLVART